MVRSRGSVQGDRGAGERGARAARHPRRRISRISRFPRGRPSRSPRVARRVRVLEALAPLRASLEEARASDQLAGRARVRGGGVQALAVRGARPPRGARRVRRRGVEALAFPVRRKRRQMEKGGGAARDVRAAAFPEDQVGGRDRQPREPPRVRPGDATKKTGRAVRSGPGIQVRLRRARGGDAETRLGKKKRRRADARRDARDVRQSRFSREEVSGSGAFGGVPRIFFPSRRSFP